MVLPGGGRAEPGEAHREGKWCGVYVGVWVEGWGGNASCVSFASASSSALQHPKQICRKLAHEVVQLTEGGTGGDGEVAIKGRTDW